MIRCPWCGAKNYAIDMWCKKCTRHLDWAPPRRRRSRIIGILAPLAAAVGVAIALALPAASWFNGQREEAKQTWRDGFAANKFNPWGKRCAEVLQTVEQGGEP